MQKVYASTSQEFTKMASDKVAEFKVAIAKFCGKEKFVI